MMWKALPGVYTDNDDGSQADVDFTYMDLPVTPILQTMITTLNSHSTINDVIVQNGVTTNQVRGYIYLFCLGLVCPIKTFDFDHVTALQIFV